MDALMEEMDNRRPLLQRVRATLRLLFVRPFLMLKEALRQNKALMKFWAPDIYYPDVRFLFNLEDCSSVFFCSDCCWLSFARSSLFSR